MILSLSATGQPVSTAGLGGALDPRGPAAREISDLWWVLLLLGAVVYVGVVAFLVVGLMRRRRDDSAAPGDEGVPSKWILLGGVALPAVVLAVVFGFSLASMSALTNDIPDDAVVIDVVGRQWWWEVSYEGHDFVTANEIHIPVGEPVALRVTSADVIHSFWVPQLAGKIDALPDGINTMVIEADEAGRFGGRCAEFCGLQHTKMGIDVIAEPREDFDSWLEGQEQDAVIPDGGVARRGFEVFVEAGCPECHTIKGTDADGRTGPDLTHVAGRGSLAAATLPNTPEHLSEWVANPQEIKEGTQMPDTELSSEDLEALIAFLETLK